MRDNKFTTPRSHYDWFLHCLYNDEEFVTRKVHILSLISQRFGEHYLRFYQIFSTLPFITYLEKDGMLVGDIVDEIKDLATRFNISEATAVYGLGYNGSNPENGAVPYISSIAGDITIHISPTTRRRDVLEIWGYVKELQKQSVHYKPNNQATLDPRLIYAIYKQRLPGKGIKKKTFPEILKMYKTNTLPLYDVFSVAKNKRRIFETPYDLERDYDKYKPKPADS